MRETTMRRSVIKEINSASDTMLSDIYNLICNLKRREKADNTASEDIMRFAGCWEWTDEEMREFLEESKQQRRGLLFSRRERQV